MKLFVSLLFLFITFNASAEKKYQKNYYDNGTIESEGWLIDNQKNGYWKFYYNNGVIKKEGRFLNNKPTKYWYFYTSNGNKKSEGHYLNGEKANWWLFYDDMEKINHKCQLQFNQKNGYCLMYKNEKLISAAKFKAGKKIKEWTNFKSFKKENNLSDLQ